MQWYNTEHRHSAIRFVTPEQYHQDEEHQILEHRKTLYEHAKARNPQRWFGPTRYWSPIEDGLAQSAQRHPGREAKLSKSRMKVQRTSFLTNTAIF